MGIWGAGPFDNDDACDMVAKMMDPINRVLDLPLSVPRKRVRGKRRVASDYYPEARAVAAVVLLAHGTDVLGGPSLQLVLDALKKMRSDDDWLSQWDKNHQRSRFGWEVRCSIDKQIRAVRRKIRLCCQKRRVKSVRRRGRVLR